MIKEPDDIHAKRLWKAVQGAPALDLGGIVSPNSGGTLSEDEPEQQESAEDSSSDKSKARATQSTRRHDAAPLCSKAAASEMVDSYFLEGKTSSSTRRTSCR